MLGYEREMEGKVRDAAGSRSQQEQILRTQIRVMQNELGEGEDNDDAEELPSNASQELKLDGRDPEDIC